MRTLLYLRCLAVFESFNAQTDRINSKINHNITFNSTVNHNFCTVDFAGLSIYG